MIDEELFNDNTESETKPINFATIDKVFDDGVTLIFDGEEEPTQKHYKVNSFAIFKAGDRVRIIKDSGTYVVEYSVGNPKKIFNADTSTSANTANTANSANTANIANTATNATNAVTATSSNVANEIKNAFTNYANIKIRMQYSNMLQFSTDGYTWYGVTGTRT